MLVIGLTVEVGGIHAALADTEDSTGFARALCRRTLQVSVDHIYDGIGERAVIAVLTGEKWPVSERPSCLRCIRSMEAMNKLAL